jgi:signal peptidase I
MTARVSAPAALVATLLFAFAFVATAIAGESPPVTTVKTPTKEIRSTRYGDTTMEPTIHCGAPSQGCLGARPDTIVIREPIQTVKRFDIVAFTHWISRVDEVCGSPVGGFFPVQRVIGLPGETWSERHGYVYINGKKLNEPYIGPLFRDHSSYRPRTIPAGEYVLMGDNRAHSCDSRRFGSVPFSALFGRVVRIARPTFKR